MKALFLSLCIILHLTSFCQIRKTNFTIDYAQLYAESFNNHDNENEPIWTHQAFVKAEFPLSKKWSFSTGLGFMNLHFVRISHSFNYKDTESHFLYNYLVIPAGLVYKIGFIDVLPEVGLGYNFNNTLYYYFYSDPDQPPEKYDFNNFYPDPPNFIVPFFLTIQTEIRIKQFSLLLGLKGFAENDNFRGAFKGQSYGYGLLIGLKY